MAIAAPKFTTTTGLFSAAPSRHHHVPPFIRIPLTTYHNRVRVCVKCKAIEVSPPSSSSVSPENWVHVVPVSAMPKGERRVIIQDGETILLLLYKDAIYAIENRSPAEGAYSEGLINAKLTQRRSMVRSDTAADVAMARRYIEEEYDSFPVVRCASEEYHTRERENIQILIEFTLQVIKEGHFLPIDTNS